MPGDEVHEEAVVPSAQEASDAGRGRTGPRHAAPRKPLLNRLHVPAGKAIAIAAMPSAVLMGMGLTPQLASAKPLPKNPFKGDACVSQPDKDENAQEKAEEEAAKRKAAREKAEREKEKDEQAGGSDSSKPEPAPSEGSPSGDGGGSGGSGSGGSGGGSEDPEPSPSPSEPDEDEDEDDGGGLLGGVGDAIGDIFDPKDDEEDEEKEAEEKEEEKASPSPSGSGSGSSSDAGKPVEDTVGKVGDGLKDTTDGLGKGAKDKLPSAGDDEAGKGGAAGKDGKAFPCVEQKKSAGKDEQTPNSIPNDPWELKATSLGLHGLDYKGVVNIRTQDGKTKQALKFTASSLDIGDLHQIVKGPDGTNYHVRASQGSTSTIKGGQVTMYTERLKGNLFGLIPIVFDPEHPPPLNIPEAYFTNVEVKQAGQFGGNLTVPGLHQTID